MSSPAAAANLAGRFITSYDTEPAEAPAAPNNCDLIYVSFDVDSLDPNISIGTGDFFSNKRTIAIVLSLLPLSITIISCGR